jgi:vitamin B12 transporter
LARISVRPAACAAFIIAASAPVLAQSGSPTPAPSPSEIVHVTTADRQDEPITMTTRPTFVVDRRQIQQTGARTVAQALEDIPGVSLFSYGPYGSLTNAGVLGATSAQTLVLLNGFPVAAGSIGSIDLGTFSTVGIERIEVVEGGGSTLYGSSAVGGIINIITGGESSRPYVELSGGTLGERDARIAFGLAGAGIAYERHIATNVYDYPGLDGFPPGTRTNAQAASTALRLDYRSSGRAAYTFDAGGHFTIARHGAKSALSLSFSGAHAALSYNDPQNGGETDTYDAREQISLRDVIGNGGSSFVGGIDVSRESALLNLGASNVPPVATAAITQSAVYGQYRMTVANAAIVTAGLRGEHDAPQGSVLVPALGTSINLGAARLALNYAGTFRAPTIDDLYYPGFSNPSLVPERSKNFDANLSLPLGAAAMSLDWFDRAATNLIALDQNFVPQNIAQASLGGVVLSAHTAPFHGLITTVGITDMYRALNTTPGQPVSRLDFEPVMTASLGLEKPFGMSRIAFGVDANVRGPHNEAGISRDGFTTIDAYVRARVASGLIASVRGRNVADERYAPILGYPAPGRTVEFELSTK